MIRVVSTAVGGVLGYGLAVLLDGDPIKSAIVAAVLCFLITLGTD